eukprot:749363-Hanusia_phi.AAC.1
MNAQGKLQLDNETIVESRSGLHASIQGLCGEELQEEKVRQRDEEGEDGAGEDGAGGSGKEQEE